MKNQLKLGLLLLAIMIMLPSNILSGAALPPTGPNGPIYGPINVNVCAKDSRTYTGLLVDKVKIQQGGYSETHTTDFTGCKNIMFDKQSSSTITITVWLASI